jgi:hypothetical protein
VQAEVKVKMEEDKKKVEEAAKKLKAYKGVCREWHFQVQPPLYLCV